MATAVTSGHQAHDTDQVVEKRHASVDDVEKVESDSDDEHLDLFTSFPPIKGAIPEKSPLTFRAVLIGIILGSLVNASNVYLGLKTGFSFSATLFGAIFGYGIITLITKALPNTPILGMPFGPQENSIIQAAATGAGGIGGPFVAGFPAMYRLNLFNNVDPTSKTNIGLQNPSHDFGRILGVTVICALFGLFAAIPLRKFFIINVARELNLVFPTPTATALTIRSMHAAGTGAADAARKIKALGGAFIGAIMIIVCGSYADGILHNWHIFTWFYAWGGYKDQTLMAIESWGWYIQLTPAFVGSGFLVGPNAALSWWGGTFVAWAVIGPLLVWKQKAFCNHCTEDLPKGPNYDPEDKWRNFVSYGSLGDLSNASVQAHPSPRFWMLWPGVAVLIVFSMMEFIMHLPIVWSGVVVGFRSTCRSVNNMLEKRNKHNSFLAKQSVKADEADELVEDFATKDQLVPDWVWVVGVIVMAVVAMLICHFEFDMNPGLALLALILAMIFAFLSIHGGAVTDNTPLTASSKASQLVFGGITRKHSPTKMDIVNAERVNLIAGNIASGCANVATDLVSDFRVGFLLKTPPRLQWMAQAVGTVVAIFLAPGIFVLFMSAYPCVWNPIEINGKLEKCPFGAPAVAAWQAVAQAVTLPQIPIPHECVIFTIVMAVLAGAQVVIKNLWLVGPREKYRNYLPNWMSIGVAWVIGPDSGYANAVAFGAVAGFFWKKYWPKGYDVFAYAIAAGLIAGEGLGGVINAALTLGGVDGTKKGTLIAQPGEDW